MTYNTGLWGSSRYAPGAFYFDPLLTIYVDLSAAISGGSGTITNPYNWDDLVEIAPTLDGKTLLMRGSKEETGLVSSLDFTCTTSAFTISAWDLSTYGPWRIKQDNNNIVFQMGTSGCSVAGGIIDNGSNDLTFNIEGGEGSYTFRNMYFKSVDYTIYDSNVASDRDIIFEGCTLIINGGSIDAQIDNGEVDFSATNTVIQGDISFRGGGVNGGFDAVFTNSVIDGTITSHDDSSATYVDSVSAWTCLGLPDWDDVQQLYAYSNYSNSISIEGLGDYTGYDTGLWGFARDGLGAFYFDTLSGSGHIGAFYFGTFGKSVTVPVMTVSAGLLQPTVTGVVSVSSTVTTPLPMEEFYNLLQPTVRGDIDIDVDFIGVPRIGTSPLVVDFTALVTLGGIYTDTYEVTEYRWYFDYENYPLVYESTTTATVEHVYTGYAGQDYDVRLYVIVDEK